MKNLDTIYFEAFKQERFSHKDKDEAYNGVYYVLSEKSEDSMPLLLLQSGELFGSKVEECLPAAYAIELFNNSTVVLKDVTDHYSDQNVRSSIIKKLDPSGAIITGDQLMILSYKYLSLVDTSNLKYLVDIFNEAIAKYIKGQYMSLVFKNKEPLTFADYIDIVSLMTPEIMALSLRLGAIIGGASEKEQEVMYEAGKNLGLSFFLKKEWNKAFSSGENSSNENYFLYYKALELADERQKTILKNNEISTPEVKELFSKLHIREVTESLISTYKNKAISLLKSLDLDQKKMDKLVESAR